MGEFVAAIRERRPPSVPGEEGRRTLALLLACYESARLGTAIRVTTLAEGAHRA
jgi:predicted dehydrogenase